MNRIQHTPSPHKVAVILGNGPSLRGFNFADELNGFDTFGMNAAYRHWDAIGWYPTYYSCLDFAVGYSHKDKIARLVQQKDSNGIKAFMLRMNVAKGLAPQSREAVVNYDFWLVRNRYHLFMASNYLTTGALTTLWAATLGYRHIILLGMDANFAIPRHEEAKFVCPDNAAGELAELRDKYAYGKVQILTETPASNANYFFDGYQQKGDYYFITDQQKTTENESHIKSWEFLPDLLKKFDAAVLNANMSSRITVFRKAPWEEVKAALLESDNPNKFRDFSG